MGGWYIYISSWHSWDKRYRFKLHTYNEGDLKKKLKAREYLQDRQSEISGLDYWTGILDWTIGMTFGYLVRNFTEIHRPHPLTPTLAMQPRKGLSYVRLLQPHLSMIQLKWGGGIIMMSAWTTCLYKITTNPLLTLHNVYLIAAL